jgi:hypothetical protein
VLDVERVPYLHPVPGVMLGALIRELSTLGTAVVVVDPEERGLFPDAAAEFRSLDAALARCEVR